MMFMLVLLAVLLCTAIPALAEIDRRETVRLFRKVDKAYNDKIQSGRWLRFAVRLHDEDNAQYATGYYNIGDHQGQLLPPMYFGILFEPGREGYCADMDGSAYARVYLQQTLAHALPKVSRSLYDPAILQAEGCPADQLEFVDLYTTVDEQGNIYCVFGVTEPGITGVYANGEAYVLLLANLRHGGQKYLSCYLYVDQADVADFIRALDVPQDSLAAAWLKGSRAE